MNIHMLKLLDQLVFTSACKNYLKKYILKSQVMTLTQNAHLEIAAKQKLPEFLSAL